MIFREIAESYGVTARGFQIAALKVITSHPEIEGRVVREALQAETDKIKARLNKLVSLQDQKQILEMQQAGHPVTIIFSKTGVAIWKIKKVYVFHGIPVPELRAVFVEGKKVSKNSYSDAYLDLMSKKFSGEVKPVEK